MHCATLLLWASSNCGGTFGADVGRCYINLATGGSQNYTAEAVGVAVYDSRNPAAKI